MDHSANNVKLKARRQHANDISHKLAPYGRLLLPANFTVT